MKVNWEVLRGHSTLIGRELKLLDIYLATLTLYMKI